MAELFSFPMFTAVLVALLVRDVLAFFVRLALA